MGSEQKLLQLKAKPWINTEGKEKEDLNSGFA